MNLIRFDPFRELEQMSARLSSMFGRMPVSAVENGAEGFTAWSPAIDVQETDAEYLVKADLPEVAKNELKIGIDDGVLTVEGERKQEKEEKGKKFHRVERSYGKFVRRLAVPSDVDESKVAAEFKDGVLNVHLPKSPAAKPRAIDVKIA
jgi:HSP20 family protein